MCVILFWERQSAARFLRQYRYFFNIAVYTLSITAWLQWNNDNNPVVFALLFFKAGPAIFSNYFTVNLFNETEGITCP